MNHAADRIFPEICEDIKEECEKYGQVLEMKVPRPSGGSRQSTGVGKIFVKYDNADSARTALQALAGRKFADRTVVTTYFSEVSPHPLSLRFVHYDWKPSPRFFDRGNLTSPFF